MTDITVTLPELACRIHDALQRGRDCRDGWIESRLDLGRSLKAARDAFEANQDFHRWLVENDIELNRNDRAALIRLAQHEQKAREYFERKPECWFRVSRLGGDQRGDSGGGVFIN